MSVVHDNLSRRAAGVSSDAAAPGPEARGSAPEDGEDFAREVRRKETLLTEGIRDLQKNVAELAAKLAEAEQELQRQREENERLRPAVAPALARRGQPPEPSLLSMAMK
jgi:hypothetical protein